MVRTIAFCFISVTKSVTTVNANSKYQFYLQIGAENMLYGIFAFINEIISLFDFLLKKILVIFVHGLKGTFFPANRT